MIKCRIQIRKRSVFLGIILLFSTISFAQENRNKDTLSFSTNRFIHKIGLEIRPAYIFPVNSFFKGENETGKPIRDAFSAHLKYAFQHPYNSAIDQLYGGAYQGIGLGYYSFSNRREIGNPIALYLFQGAQIARLSSRLSLNYEWNFGLSFGWKPYDYETNYWNTVVGLKTNAYLDADFYLNWALSDRFDLMAGLSLSHFSNGNTKYPNAGVNTAGLKIGLTYTMNRKLSDLSPARYQSAITDFPHHVSYDLVLFGSWRRKGIHFGDEKIVSPDTYTVLGFNFAPMYNFGYKFRAGVSVDGFYDGSANVYTDDYYAAGTTMNFYKPSLSKQLALGLSGRIEYVMPYFTVNLGVGINALHRGGDLKGFYQVLALKMDITRNTFLHIGYSIHDFKRPNFLMLGIGFRFNNKYPVIRR